LAVIGAFIDFANSTSPFIKQIVDNSNLAIGETKVVTIDYTNAVSAIKSRTQLYRYTGSLTTPPCTVFIFLIGFNFLSFQNSRTQKLMKHG
jgi:carbonic anhydrase